VATLSRGPLISTLATRSTSCQQQEEEEEEEGRKELNDLGLQIFANVLFADRQPAIYAAVRQREILGIVYINHAVRKYINLVETSV
jgi:hypothetical protein